MIKNPLIFLLALGSGIFLAGANGSFKGPIDGISTIPSHPQTIDTSVADLQVPPEPLKLGTEEKDPPRFHLAGANSDEEVKELYRKFQKAVATNDKNAAALLMNYPLQVNFPGDPIAKKPSWIKDRKSFIRVFDRLFDKRLKDFISNLDLENGDDFIIRYDGIGTGRGEIWIGVYCYDSQCKNPQTYVKIRTIYANSYLMGLK